MDNQPAGQAKRVRQTNNSRQAGFAELPTRVPRKRQTRASTPSQRVPGDFPAEPSRERPTTPENRQLIRPPSAPQRPVNRPTIDTSSLEDPRETTSESDSLEVIASLLDKLNLAPNSPTQPTTSRPTTPVSPKMGFPSPMSRDAPKFDEKSPEELLRFIQRMEDLWVQYPTEADTDEKKIIMLGKYASPVCEDDWKSFNAYTGKDWSKFKDELIASYPAAMRLQKGSLHDLDKLCSRYVDRNSLMKTDLEEIMALKLKFTTLSRKLAGQVSERDLIQRFLSCLERGFRDEISQALHVIDMAQNKDSLGLGTDFKVAKVMEIVVNLALRRSQSILNEGDKETRSEKPSSRRRTMETQPEETPEFFPKMEETVARLSDGLNLLLKKSEVQEKRAEAAERKFESLQSTLVSWKQSAVAPQPMQPSPMYPRPYDRSSYNNSNGFQPSHCYYCREPGHRLADCAAADKHVKSNWIKRNSEGKYALASGQPIPLQGFRSMREAVENMYRNKPGIIPNAKIQAMQGYYPEYEEDCEMFVQSEEVCPPAEDISRRLDDLVREHGKEALERVLFGEGAVDAFENFP